ncbi:Protein of unknown function [Pseudomonas sp. ok272]|uniref:DUF1302 domain-containing protein n=1 Tax=unclassified Pseudomonas TaxID=196821 RepID=UPI0008B03897|nr:MULTISPECIES: DUF1302 domain-containing protein [unclassified Pseudomonas]SEN29942.1 Protein of unknown function [Pseudomonas sp. ok272]SFN20142.1 Protein of unknown function [Pseudomonas sp. ok602]
MTSVNQFWRRAKLPLAVSLASTLAGPAFGVSFNVGEIEGQFDSTLSLGMSVSTQQPNKDLIGVNNGGKGLSQTSDDGHANFKSGQAFSKIFKGIHDLELKYGDTGVFVRGKYWYDFALQNQDLEFKNVSNDHRDQSARSSGGEFLDAFVYHNYSIADEPGTVRLGKQVISWGESTFIGGGINAINPIDVSAFRRPGAEIKEGLIPVNMFYLSQSITENLSAEGFYQIGWKKTVTDNCGTFFSQPDIVTTGCDDNLRVLNKRSTIPLPTVILPLLENNGVDINEEGVLVARSPNRNARDNGQWGASLKYMFAPLDTEFGAYFMNYHSRAPIFSATGAPQSVYNSAGALQGPFSALAPLIVAGNSSYFIDYPEDIRLYGLSFSTSLPTGTAWQGEISYRPNAPVQLNSTDILFAGVRPLGGDLKDASVLSAGPGEDLDGYRRKEITQIQTTFTHFFDQVMGASRLTLVGEIGMTYVGGLESKSKARYGRDPVFGPGELPNGSCEFLNGKTIAGAGPGASDSNLSSNCNNDGFTTSSSWGYRGRAIWDYNDAFAGVNLKPNVAWSHDVKGYSPGPGGNFEEGRKAISLGLDAEYQNTYTASLAYTNFFGGDYSTVDDRDFVALSVGVNF